MEEDRSRQLDRRPTPSQPRRYVYRSTESDEQNAHPMRRTTDTPLPFQGRRPRIQPLLLEMRAYFKLN